MYDILLHHFKGWVLWELLHGTIHKRGSNKLISSGNAVRASTSTSNFCLTLVVGRISYPALSRQVREWGRNCHPSESGACKGGGGEIYGRSTKWWYSRWPFKGENVLVINESVTDASLL